MFGPSRILVLGPDSSLAPIIAAAILPLAVADSRNGRSRSAGLLAIMVGVILFVGGLLRLGFVTDLLSKPIRIGYLNGIALVVIDRPDAEAARASPSRRESLRRGLRGRRPTGSPTALVDGDAVAIGAGSLIVIWRLRRYAAAVPGVLVAVVGADRVHLARSGGRTASPSSARCRRGCRRRRSAASRWSDVGSLALPALGIALIAFADTGVLSRTFAARRGVTVDGSQEMSAIGVANIAGGLLGGFPISASSSRTPVAEQAGAKTQLCSVVGALADRRVHPRRPVGLTAYLPVGDARGGRDRRRELADRLRPRWLAVADEQGGGIAVDRGVPRGRGHRRARGDRRRDRAVVPRVRPPRRGDRTGPSWVGVPGVRGYHDRARHADSARIPGIVIVRFDAPLFFANGGMFDDYVRSVVQDAGPDVHTVILAAEPITDIDTTALDELLELDDFLAAQGITLIIAEMKGPVKDQLRRYGLADRFDADRFAPTTGAAVDAITGEFRGDIGPDDTDEVDTK